MGHPKLRDSFTSSIYGFLWHPSGTREAVGMKCKITNGNGRENPYSMFSVMFLLSALQFFMADL